jgi:hypothetical protein
MDKAERVRSSKMSKTLSWIKKVGQTYREGVISEMAVAELAEINQKKVHQQAKTMEAHVQGLVKGYLYNRGTSVEGKAGQGKMRLLESCRMICLFEYQ